MFHRHQLFFNHRTLAIILNVHVIYIHYDIHALGFFQEVVWKPDVRGGIYIFGTPFWRILLQIISTLCVALTDYHTHQSRARGDGAQMLTDTSFLRLACQSFSGGCHFTFSAAQMETELVCPIVPAGLLGNQCARSALQAFGC